MGHKLILSRQGTGGSDSALNQVVITEKQNNSYKPSLQAQTVS